MSDDFRKNVEDMFKWLWPKFEWSLITVGIVGAGLLGTWIYLEATKPSESQSQYAYSNLPKKCICTQCGYVIENPGKHCPELVCPRCGGRMRRLE